MSSLNLQKIFYLFSLDYGHAPAFCIKKGGMWTGLSKHLSKFSYSIFITFNVFFLINRFYSSPQSFLRGAHVCYTIEKKG